MSIISDEFKKLYAVYFEKNIEFNRMLDHEIYWFMDSFTKDLLADEVDIVSNFGVLPNLVLDTWRIYENFRTISENKYKIEFIVTNFHQSEIIVKEFEELYNVTTGFEIDLFSSNINAIIESINILIVRSVWDTSEFSYIVDLLCRDYNQIVFNLIVSEFNLLNKVVGIKY